MTITGQEELEGLRQIGRIVSQTLQRMREEARPGMTTRELDEIGLSVLEKAGARSAPILAYNFPGATCISINEEIAHGIPGDRVMKEGDVVNVDVSAEYNGFYADTGCSFVLEPVPESTHHLLECGRNALKQALKVAKHGRYLNEVGQVIEQIAVENGFKPIRNLGSHGVGRKLHEEPSFIPGFYAPFDRRRFEEGMVVTIEPFLSTDTNVAVEASDGWTLKGPSGNLSAQFEHTIVITRDEPIILTENPYI
jgi:methionyl aminopeptidase